MHSIRLKYEIWSVGRKFDTDSGGLNPKATGLHLVGVGGDTLGSTLALPASWAEVEGSNGGPRGLLFLFDIKQEIRPGGSKIDTDSRGLSPKATGLHLVSVGGDTLGSTFALPASWAEVGLEGRTPELWFLFDIKHEIRPGGPKFDTDSRGFSPKATG